MLTILSAACADRQQCAGSGMPLPYNALPLPVSCNFTIKTAVLRDKESLKEELHDEKRVVSRIPDPGCSWISLIFTIGFSWVYIRYAVPDQLNLVVNEEEVFHFALPPGSDL